MDVTVVLCESLTDWLMRMVWQFIMCKYEVVLLCILASQKPVVHSFLFPISGHLKGHSIQKQPL